MVRSSSLVLVTILALACGGDATPAPVPPVASSAPAASSSAPVASSAPAASSSSPVAAPNPKPLAVTQLETLRAASDAINEHDAKKYAALFTRTAIHKEAATRDLVGRDEIARRMSLLFGAFPDFNFAFERVWQKGDVTIATWHWSGTDRGGGFMGKAPSRRRGGISGVTVGFFNIDGLLREVHVYEDGQTVLSQLDAAAKAGTFRLPADPTPGTFTVNPSGPDEDANTQVVKALYYALEAKKDVATFADDATVDDFALPPRPAKGGAAWKSLVKSWTGNFGAFTELPLYDLVAVGDTVVVERVLKGSVAPGASVQLHACDVIQLKGGKITSFGSYSNTLELVSQVGTKGVRRP